MGERGEHARCACVYVLVAAHVTASEGRVRSRWLCRLMLRHRGRVGADTQGAFWMCNNCGSVIR